MSLYSDLNEVLTPYAQKIKEKADKSTTYTKNEVDDLISEVVVETDTTLVVPGAPADAAETGRQIGLLEADLGDVTEDTASPVLFLASTVGKWYIDMNTETIEDDLYSTPVKTIYIPVETNKTYRVTCTKASTKRYGFVNDMTKGTSIEGATEVEGTLDAVVKNTNKSYFVIQLFRLSDTDTDINDYLAVLTIDKITGETAVDTVARSVCDVVKGVDTDSKSFYGSVLSKNYIDTENNKISMSVSNSVISYCVSGFDRIIVSCPILSSKKIAFANKPAERGLAIANAVEYRGTDDILVRSSGYNYMLVQYFSYIDAGQDIDDYLAVATVTSKSAIDHYARNLIMNGGLFTSGISDYLRYGLHTVPPSEGAFNAIKRARQLTDAKWTPVANLPRTMVNTSDSYLESHGKSYQGQFAADKRYEGMPYSYTFGTPRYIGINEPIDLFYSCLTNQNSVLYTNSAYSGMSAVYYGTTCSTVVGYALNLPNIDSNYYYKIKGMKKLYDLVTSGVRHDINDMRIGDVLIQTTHVVMVGDIIKDGINVTDIEILEGTRQGCTDKTVLNSELGGVARRFWMTIDEFFAWFDGFALYRYQYIDSVKFVRNPYVPLVYGEKSMPTRYFPCMPFYGNRKVFTSNENEDAVRVLIHDTNYTHLIVYKDGVQYGVYEITGLSYVDVNCEYGEAEYSANLITYDNENQINAKSIACYWYMMPEYDFTITDDESYHNISVTMRKGNFVPWYVTFKSSATENNPDGFTIVKSSYEASTSGDMTTYTFSVEKGSSDSNVCILGLQSIKYAYFKLQKTY